MVDYIIIGAGVYGCALAWELSRQGFEVQLLDSGQIAGRASGGPGRRGVRANARDRRELPLMTAAYDVWPTLHETLGSPAFYERTGQLLLVEGNEAREAAKALCWMQQQFGIDTQLLKREEILEHEPRVNEAVTAALYCPNDGVADHGATTKAYAAAAAKEGTQIKENSAATLLEVKDGKIKSVATEHGEAIIPSRGVFLLSNANVATQIQTLTGVQLPVWNACLQVLISEPLDFIPFKHLIGHMSRTVSLKPEGDDRIMISGGWPGCWDESTQTGSTLKDSVAGNVAESIAVSPSLADLRIAVADANHLEAMSVDDIPIIDQAPGIDNLWFVTGCSGHGWAIAPIVAALLAQWVITGKSQTLLEPFRLGRFFSN